MDNKLQKKKKGMAMRSYKNKVSNRQAIGFTILRNITYLNNICILNKVVGNKKYRPMDIYCIVCMYEKSIQNGVLVLRMATI